MSPPPGAPRYDSIGRTYAQARRADPRVAARINAALGDAHTIVNVGAGTGNYEPADRSVVAVEPSRTMIEQRPSGAAPVVQGVAERLPVATGAFHAALALLTVHHWSDLGAGLRELERVAEHQVIFLFDASITNTYWLVDDYFPEAYLDPTVRAGISWLAQLDPSVVDRNVARLAAELADGRWDATYGHLRSQDSLDIGYRLVVCG